MVPTRPASYLWETQCLLYTTKFLYKWTHTYADGVMQACPILTSVKYNSGSDYMSNFTHCFYYCNMSLHEFCHPLVHCEGKVHILHALLLNSFFQMNKPTLSLLSIHTHTPSKVYSSCGLSLYNIWCMQHTYPIWPGLTSPGSVLTIFS